MSVAKLCGSLDGKEILVAGKNVVMIFHTDGSEERKGFRLRFVGKCSGKEL